MARDCNVHIVTLDNAINIITEDAHHAIISREDFEAVQQYMPLQEAMKIVWSEAENYTMHASKLADEIYERRLYLYKNGKKAKYIQVRARCGHYPDMFEALPGNYIKLKE